MLKFSLHAICLVVSLCGTVSAQQNLVEYSDKDDPCARFKMRILVPGSHVDFKHRAEKLKDGIDSRMVWNPCAQAEPQFAFAPATRTLDRPENFLMQQSFGFQSTVKNGQKKRADFPLPQRPSPFDKLLQQ